eukprot:403332108
MIDDLRSSRRVSTRGHDDTMGQDDGDNEEITRFLKKQQYFGKLGIDPSQNSFNTSRQTLDTPHSSRKQNLNMPARQASSSSQLIMSRLSVGAGGESDNSRRFGNNNNNFTQSIEEQQTIDSKLDDETLRESSNQLDFEDSQYMTDYQNNQLSSSQQNKLPLQLDKSKSEIMMTYKKIQYQNTQDSPQKQRSRVKSDIDSPNKLVRQKSQQQCDTESTSNTANIGFKNNCCEDSPFDIAQDQIIEFEDDDSVSSDTQKFSIVDQDKNYMLSFIMKSKESEQANVMIKTHDQIRHNFLSKLVYQNVWITPQQKPKTHQTCIIFDWDDTILCTTFLVPYPSLLQDPNRKIPQNMMEILHQLDDAAEKVLRLAKQLGMVFIITNAAEGWVEMSSQRFLPKVHKVLQDNVTIISARTKFERLFPHNYQEWKIRAFLEAQEVLDNDAITNLIAIGDNNIEIEAAYHLASQFQQAFIKTVKFRESPSPQELTKQLKLVYGQFEQIVTTPKNLTVRLQKFGKNSKDKEIEEEERIVKQRKLFLKRQQSQLEQSKQEKTYVY